MNQSLYNQSLQIREVLYNGFHEELYPLFSGYQVCPPLHRIETLRDHYLLCCVQSGYGTFYNGSLTNYKEKGEYRMGPGDTFLISPGRLASYVADEYEPWSYAWISFAGSSAGKYLNHTDFSHTPVVHTGKDIYDSIHAITEKAIALEDSQLRYLYAAAALWNMIADLMQHSQHSQHSSSPKKINNYTEKALEIIRRNYHMPLNISDIAAELGITREYFYTLFKNDTGKSPTQYLLDLRIEKACTMLRESDYPICLIAQHTGFSDNTYFSRKFHELVGVSPSAYRKDR